MLARDAWKDSTEFHPLTPDGILATLKARCGSRSAGVVLVDLDQTVYRNTPRTRRILKEVVPQIPSLPTPVASLLTGLTDAQMGYSLRDTLRRHAIDPDTPEVVRALDAIRKLWWPRFFSNEFLPLDVPMEHSPAFCRAVAETGVGICYLSARDDGRMRAGTIANLKRDGFPWGEARFTVRLKDTPGGDDAFKVSVAQELGTKVVASLENEPKNLLAIQRAQPQAMHIFLDTVCSETPTLPGRDLFRMQHFPK